MAPKIASSSRIALVVLGMHGSGASALAGVLGHMGCDLPQDHAASGNGQFEPAAVARLNADILASAGYRCGDLRPFPATWLGSPKATEFRELAIKAIRDEFGASHLFVLKGAQISSLVPFWKKALTKSDCRPAYICLHRHPLDVAETLARHHNIDPEISSLMWLRQVLDAEYASRGAQRIFLSFERLTTDWAGAVRTISDGLDLKWPRPVKTAAPAVLSFLRPASQALASGAEPPEDQRSLQGWVADTFAIMEEWASTGERRADHKLLDRLRSGLDLAGPSLAETSLRSAAERTELLRIESRNTELETRVSQALQRLAELEAASNDQQQALTEADTRLAEVTRALEHAQAESRGHAGNHLIEQQARGAAEDRIAALTDALDLVRAERDAIHAEVGQSLQDTLATAQAREAELLELLAQNEQKIGNLHLEQQMLEDRQRQALQDTLATAQAREAELLEQLVQNEQKIGILHVEQQTLEDQLRQVGKKLSASEQSADQVRSALIQRGQEADDLHQLAAERALRIADLEATLAAMERDHDTLSRQSARDRLHLGAMTRRLTTLMQRDLEKRLLSEAAKASQVFTDDAIDATTAQFDTAQTMAEHDDELARIRQANDQRIAELEVALAETRERADHDRQHLESQIAALDTLSRALQESTSWVVTRPLRMISSVLRRRKS
ncbi:MAG: hypothetical protein Q7J57_05210 [Gemmobacter sp.]|nr:hypothetical protein [Gemmobacter sp.]